MPFTLGLKALAAGYRLSAYETIGSTSAEALDRAKGGDPGRLWVVSTSQTAGRGRRGRAWETPRGNLAASLLMSGPVDPQQSARLGFAAGLALESAIRACAPGVAVRLGMDRGASVGTGLRLKWPNDVLVDGAKVAGILLEAVTTREMTRMAIGIGVNVEHSPEGLPYPATSLAACGAPITAEQLFEALSDAWIEQDEIWDSGRGFPVIRSRWLERAAGLGAAIAVGVGDTTHRGTFETIDEEGRLILRGADGSARAITAGEVHFGAASTAGH
jgi:BirA family biotin operon repressor/biotin-[acetyl-CoA-carboxylase] ligase